MTLNKFLKHQQKKIKNDYINEINHTLHRARQANNGRIPHNMVASIVKESKDSFLWVTRNIINKLLTKFVAQKQYDKV